MTQGTPAAPVAVPAVIEPTARSLSVTAAYMDPGRLTALRQFSAIMVESRALPRHWDSWQKVFVALVYADSVGLRNPMPIFTSGFVINGKLGCEVKLMHALAIRTGQLEDFQLGGDAKSAWCIVKRRGMTAHKEVVTFEEAVACRWNMEPKKDREGKPAKGADGRTEYQQKHTWNDRALMLKWRVEGRCLRFTFPDALLGIYLFDELDLPTRIEGSEVVVDAEAIALETQPAPTAQAEVREAEKLEREQATEFQRQVVSTLFAEKGPDGKPYVPPAERKKWSQALAADGSTSMYAAAIDSLQAIVTEAKDKEQGGLHAAPPIQGEML